MLFMWQLVTFFLFKFCPVRLKTNVITLFICTCKEMETDMPDFTESRWCSHAHILLAEKDSNAISAVRKGFLQNINSYKSGSRKLLQIVSKIRKKWSISVGSVTPFM
jgi:hypothetical protein